MKRKDIVLRARVKAHHEQRVKELCEQTHMSFSELFRALIEGAEIKLRPVPGATINLALNGQNKTTSAKAYRANAGGA